MPVYEVQTPDGRTLEIESDQMPTADQLQAVVAGLGRDEAPSAPASKFDQDFPGLRAKLNEQDANVVASGRFMRDNLPAMGAMAATAATGGAGLIPGMALAALGGSGGRATQIALDRLQHKDSPQGLNAAKDIAQSGAIQGAIEGGMGLLGKGLVNLGGGIYRGLLKPSKALRDSFGGEDIVQTLIKERIPISGRGDAALGRRLGQSRDAALGMVRQAEASGAAPVTGRDVVPAFQSVVTELRKRADIGQPSELAKVGDRGRAIVQRARGGFPLSRAQALKETAQDAASGAYRQVERGTVPQVSAEGLLDMATAKGLKEAIESRVSGSLGKDLAAQNARTQSLLGAKRALEDALERSSNNYAIGGVRDALALGAGAGVGGYAGGEEGATIGALLAAITRPGMGSRIAIGLDRAGGAPLANLLRGLLAASHETGQ